MPPLFVYAVVFLSVLTAIGFVMCLRENAKPDTNAATPEDEPAHAPLRRAAADSARPQRAPDPARRSLDGRTAPGTSRTASPDRWVPEAREPERPAPPLPPTPGAAPGRGGKEAAGDGATLADQVAHLTQVVADLRAELRAERQGFEEEIRRLRRIVGERSDAGIDRPTGTAPGEPANVRHISIRDLRVRRVGG